MPEQILHAVQNGVLDRNAALHILRALSRETALSDGIAVVGMAGRWPGAEDLRAFWQALERGLPVARPFPQARRKRLDDACVSAQGAATYHFGAYLDEIEYFDPEFFGMSLRDASLMDPAHRLFLETAWAAFEDAGTPLTRLAGTQTGVYVGYCSGSDDVSYESLIARAAPDLRSFAFTGTLPPMLPARLSKIYDLRGPSILLDTGCSSSLLAVHAAVQALHNGECDTALVAGVKTLLSPLVSDDAIGIESKDGITRPFAGGKGGTGIGEGAGAVILKRLADAKKSGDRIYCVIVGSAVNNDGKSGGLTAPNVRGQQDVLEAAWRAASLGTDDLAHIEAHGTGTRVGDPVEFEALGSAIRKLFEGRSAGCTVASAKSVFGHLDGAAGITGLIAGALCAHHGKRPPSRSFQSPNPFIPYLRSPLRLDPGVSNRPLGAGAAVGISSFSMVGTNCHIVVRGVAPGGSAAASPNAETVLLLSSHDMLMLREDIVSMAAFLSERVGPEWTSVVRSAACRAHFPHRLAIVVRTKDEAVVTLAGILSAWAAGTEMRDYAHVASSMEVCPAVARSPCGLTAREIAKAYLAGDSIDWHELYNSSPQCWLPPRSLRRVSCWFTPSRQLAIRGTRQESGPTPERSVMEVVRDTWVAVLDASNPTGDEHFFECGGDSLKAAVLMSRLSKRLDRELKPTVVWEYPVLRSLAAYLDSTQVRTGESGCPAREALPRAEGKESYPLTPVQRQFYLHSMMKSDTAYNIPFGLVFEGMLDRDRLSRAIQQLISADPGLQLIMAMRKGRPCFVVGEDAVAPLAYAEADSDAALTELLREFIKPHSLHKGPLARFMLVRLAQDRHMLAIDFHHAIMDGVSVSIWIERLRDAYETGIVVSPDRTSLDFACWFESALRDGYFEPHIAHWKQVLDGKNYGLLNLGRPRAGTDDFEGGRYTITVDQGVFDRVRQFARTSGLGLFPPLLIAYSVAISLEFGQSKFNLGTPMSGRNLSGLDQVIGMFVNMFPVPVDIDAGATLRSHIQAVAEWLRNAIEFQDFPLQALELDGKTPRSSQLYNAVFILQSLNVHPFSLGEKLRAEPYRSCDMPWNLVRFDLDLYAMEIDGELVLNFEHRLSAVEPERIKNLSEVMQAVLSHLPDMLNEPVSALLAAASPATRAFRTLQ
jgi:3-oxoacyl-(acyl-carrier-protein) synthase/acyl carrier protein